ncbi:MULTISPECIES: 2,4'-dihydroxyacetophenone dioxygenase family protein [unclassified Gordonia (in: high G+C Gram-positive bacteria)]
MSVTATNPGNVSNLTELERAELAVVERYAAEDRYVSGDEVPWFPWVGALELKMLRADNRSGQFVVGLRSAEDAMLGKHRHRGAVAAVTTKGRWHYFEYDWMATPGDYVRESPGTIHTLHLFADTEIYFTIEGSIEFLNDDDTLNNTMDIWSFVHLYEDHCARTGTEFNHRIFY